MMQRNEKCLSVYLLPALLTPVPLIAFTSEKITCCANETAKSTSRNSTKFKSKNPKKPKRNPKILQQILLLFISCFTVSVTPSSNTPKSSHDFIISAISFISLFEINR